MSWFLFLILLGTPFISTSAPLTEGRLKIAKKIAFMTGAFDPWSSSDDREARRLIKSGEADLVVILPVDDGTLEIPLPVSKRMELIDSALNSNSDITYPLGPLEEVSSDALELKNYILDSNTTAKVFTAKAPKSSINIRAYMTENPHLYFNPSGRIVPEGINPEVFDKILENGLYIGRQPETGSAAAKGVKRFMRSTARNLSKYEPIKQIMTSDGFRKFFSKMLANPDLKEYSVNGKVVKIEKYLASGINGDAYIVTMDGEQLVLKVAKDRLHSHQSMQQARLVHQWLEMNTNIILPDLVAFDESGNYLLLELVKGRTLDQYLSERESVIPAELEESLKAFFKDVQDLNQASAIKLDISGDNIFIRENGEIVLVDFGPTRPNRPFANSFSEIKERWLSSSRMIEASRERSCNWLLQSVFP